MAYCIEIVLYKNHHIMKNILTILLAFMSLHASSQNMYMPTEPSVTKFGDSYMN